VHLFQLRHSRQPILYVAHPQLEEKGDSCQRGCRDPQSHVQCSTAKDAALGTPLQNGFTSHVLLAWHEAALQAGVACRRIDHAKQHPVDVRQTPFLKTATVSAQQPADHSNMGEVVGWRTIITSSS
jgi:hypothetical protein